MNRIDTYISDLELVKDISFGDKELYDALFLKYRFMLYGVCLKYLKNQKDAEDQVILLYEVMHRRMLSKDIHNLKSWMYTLTKNSCLEQLRKLNTQKEKLVTAQNVYYDQLLHQESITNEAMLERLGDCIKELKELQQKCIKAFYLEEQNYEEISLAFDMKWKEVRSHIQNGRRNLKNCMNR